MNRALALLLLVGCDSHLQERTKEAQALAAATSRTDPAAIGAAATTCFPGTANPRGKQLASGGYGIVVIEKMELLTNAHSLDGLKREAQHHLAGRMFCTLKAARGRHLEELYVHYRFSIAKGVTQDVYVVKATLAKLDALAGWEDLDPADVTDMKTLWEHVEVVKESWDGIEVR